MTELPDKVATFEALRRTRTLGRRTLWYDELGSTNAHLRNLAEAGAEEGTVVVADAQSDGRGRSGTPWASPPGGLWFSVLLRPRHSASEVASFMPRTGAALASVLERRLGIRAGLKLPNDVLVEGLKVSGILAEAVSLGGDPVPRYVVLGIGINLANGVPPHLSGIATTLAEHCKRLPSQPELLAWVLEALEGELSSSLPPPLGPGSGSVEHSER